MQRYVHLAIGFALCAGCSAEDPVGVFSDGGTSAAGAASVGGAPTSMAGAPTAGSGSATAGAPDVAGAAGASAGSTSDVGGSGGAAVGTGGAAGSGGSGLGGSSGSTGIDPGTEGDGDVSLGPSYTKHADLTLKQPAGKQFSFTMSSSSSKIFDGLDATLSSPKAFTRKITVHIPAKYQDGTAAPFMVVPDGANFRYNGVRTAIPDTLLWVWRGYPGGT